MNEKILHTMFLAMALVGANGCSRDEDESTAPRSSATAGSDDDAQHTQHSSNDVDHDDVDDDADERVEEDRRRNHAQRATAQAESSSTPTPAPAPVAQTSAPASDGAAAASTTNSATPAASGDLPTAQDQPVGTSDEDITRHIRETIVADGSLSMAAHNVTIVTRSGVVTLRGSLNGDERSAVERHAHAASGVRRVSNHISVSR